MNEVWGRQLSRIATVHGNLARLTTGSERVSSCVRVCGEEVRDVPVSVSEGGNGGVFESVIILSSEGVREGGRDGRFVSPS